MKSEPMRFQWTKMILEKKERKKKGKKEERQKKSGSN